MDPSLSTRDCSLTKYGTPAPRKIILEYHMKNLGRCEQVGKVGLGFSGSIFSSCNTPLIALYVGLRHNAPSVAENKHYITDLEIIESQVGR
jgi:hypothetical protein